MIEEAFEKEVKVLVVGNGAVGKTSMMKRFCRDNFTDEYKKTIGVDFLEKTRYVDALREDVRLMVWDTAGQEEFDTITRTYYRGAGAAVLVFSTTDRASFDAIRRWRDKVEEQCGPIAMCICQNKVDLIDDAAVDPGEPEALARELGLKLYRVCVKDDFNVDAVFDYLVDQWSKIPEETGVGPAMDISEIAKGERRGVAGGTWQAAALGRARAGGGWRSAAEAAGIGNGRGPGTPRTGTGTEAGIETRTGTGDESFKIVPSTRRTGGKKRTSARVASKCSS